MTDVRSFAADIKERRTKAQAKVNRLRNSLAAATKDLEELDVALNVLVKHGYIEGDEDQPQPAIAEAAGFSNENHALLYSYVPEGEASAISPKEVTDAIHATGRTDLNADYVRTVLWRMAQRNTLESRDGRYWRPTKKEEAPAEAEASQFRGPVGREVGYPPSTPEGSNPSGSTPSQAAEVDAWDDDDVPF